MDLVEPYTLSDLQLIKILQYHSQGTKLLLYINCIIYAAHCRALYAFLDTMLHLLVSGPSISYCVVFQDSLDIAATILILIGTVLNCFLKQASPSTFFWETEIDKGSLFSSQMPITSLQYQVRFIHMR